MNKNILLVLVVLTAFGCAPSQGSLRAAQFARHFPDLVAHPLAERLAPVPEVLLEDLKEGDGRRDYRSHPITDADRALVATVLEALPSPLKAALASNVKGISFIDQFAGGGMTWDLYDDQGTSAGFWLVFNGRVLIDTTSQWLTYRDNTAFAPAPGIALTETAVPEVPALRFLLTHEAAHVFDFVHGVTPTGRELVTRKPVVVTEGDFGFGRRYPLDAGWHFYDLVPGPKPGAQTLPAALDALTASGYPSLYGSQTALEDWAELVTYGVLLRDAGIGITLRLTTGTGPERRWSPTEDPSVQARIGTALARLDTP